MALNNMLEIMKKSFRFMMLATAAVVVFASCAKEIAAPEETSVARKTITVKTDIATKTTLDANHVNIVWVSEPFSPKISSWRYL